jgi:acyl-CoA synthetase (AMP-forming)/AMP-acid ligase II
MMPTASEEGLMSEPSRPTDILTLHARTQPDKAAVIEDRPGGGVMQWSFAELERQANRLGNALLQLGVRPRDKIVWCGLNSPGIVRMMHAARKIGATAVPLNYRLTPEEATYVVDNCDAVLVYVDAGHRALFEQIRGQLPKVRHYLVFEAAAAPGFLDSEALVAAAGEDEPRVEQGAEQASTMIYTSGTTGHPKGAMRRSAGDPQSVQRLMAEIGYVPHDVYLTTGPLYHSGPGGFMALAHALSNTVVVQRKFDPEDWLRLVEKYRVSTTFSAPTPIRLVCNLPPEVKARYDGSSMKRMIANAAPWSFALKEMYLRDFPADSLWEVYGSTELGVDTILRPEDQRRKPGSCGRPAPGVEVALFDDDGNEVTAANQPGELYVRSRSVFDTYYKAEEKYEKGRRGDYHSVGDVAYRDEDGYYYICDRKNDMIISGGMNIYPAEIEAALEHHPQIVDVAVFGVPSEEWGESVHAVVVVQAGAKLADQEVIAFGREHLAGYKIPRSVSFMDEIPRTGSGKILKRVLREPFWKGHRSRVI